MRKNQSHAAVRKHSSKDWEAAAKKVLNLFVKPKIQVTPEMLVDVAVALRQNQTSLKAELEAYKRALILQGTSSAKRSRRAQRA